MISVMNDFEIDRKSDLSGSSAADGSFLRMESPQEGARDGDGGFISASYEVNLARQRMDLDVEQEAKVDMVASSEDLGSLSEDNMVSFVELSSWMHGFKVGDMVWGKVKSHPWWPGHIFNEAFASSSVRRMKREGHVLVAFFGDSSYGWFDLAELIPFEPNFPEKSRQTSSRSFVKAVDEAIDEASRRVAIALTCRCRNPYNFRPTDVAGYFAVDVVGYEPGGIYSARQIKKARDSFIPFEALSFLQNLALSPLGSDGNSIEWIQSVAKLLAYRRAIFEEFDETYAQAFGVQPERTSPNSMGVLDQPDRFAPRVAPLSGPLVVAEALGSRRSSVKYSPAKPTKIAKKNKYLLKRRDGGSLPDLPSAPHGFLPSWPDSSLLPPVSSGVESSPFVLHRREMPLQSPLPVLAAASEPSSGEWRHGGEMLQTVEEIAPGKRRLEDLSEVKKKKKIKKKKEHLDADATDRDHRLRLMAGRSIGIGAGSLREAVPLEGNLPPPGLDFSSLDLPEIIDDLCSLALDPFHAFERSAPAIALHVFLRFRALVYQKSLVLPAIAAGDPTAPASLRSSSSSSAKPQKTAFRPDEPTKAGLKRGPSDRQEDLSAKKLKKIKQLKALASEKKAAINPQKTSDLQQQQTPAAPPPVPAAAAAAQPPTPKAPTPTYLVMKFPPRSTLPSVSNLKARYARFGPLDVAGTRVFWKSYSCRVLFKHRSDAQSAFDFVKSNDLFGQVKVSYFLRDLDLSTASDQPADPSKSSRGGAAAAVSVTAQRTASFNQPRQNSVQLKSILKKPGGDDSASNGLSKDSPRVTFMLDSSAAAAASAAASSLKSVGFQPSVGLEMHPQRFAPPPLPPAVPKPRGGFPPPAAKVNERRDEENFDISGPMLSLMLKCNEIVRNLKSSLGYAPYHPL
ncbi:Serine/threonine-protein kinase ATM [Apostasia shenzhenica]|uniref:Serine/threonine-protein kinase ATM n=1 Tax=Apostasia shenzhenica TaxID=1088818 RepID=A0A2I0AUX0_9ASPA|nr:Serine/threonine-protein kinase ATM [Apostasia shenzhenica]